MVNGPPEIILQYRLAIDQAVIEEGVVDIDPNRKALVARISTGNPLRTAMTSPAQRVLWDILYDEVASEAAILAYNPAISKVYP
jgi:hypothetical protein